MTARDLAILAGKMAIFVMLDELSMTIATLLEFAWNASRPIRVQRDRVAMTISNRFGGVA